MTTEQLPLESGESGAPELTVYGAITSFLTEQGLIFTEEPAQGRVRFEYASEEAAWSSFAVAFEEAQQVAIYGVLPFAVGPERRAAALELIARINYGHVIGNFEMDLDDGELRFKTSLDFEGAELTLGLLRQLFASNVAVMSHYLPAILAVVLRGRDPQAALAALEGGPSA